ncbi:MAG: AarF/ABC1/UbiB kinase family protein [Deltaproteobacteria bacterium]|nr:AarF/ABC1/UbiB kinase family protein [Deltaproteobacteria bacterium]
MRFLSLFLRAWFVLWIFIRAGLVHAWRRLRAGRLTREQAQRLRADALTEALERLGATFIKFGQILSTRPDLIGPVYVESLKTLQDAVAPEPFSHIESVLEAELPEEARARLLEIEREPIAAASVAQVHAATLDDGTKLAIKVLRPHARSQIVRDLSLMRAGVRVLEWIPSLRLLSLRGAVDRFGDALELQLDFETEARNNLRFAESFKRLEGVEVPKLVPELCTPRVLTMHFVDGARATEPEEVGGDRTTLAKRGFEAIIHMVFRDGFVHADMHPGNILLCEDGRLVFLDLGLVAEIEDELKRPWIETFLALAQQDGRRAAELFYGYAPEVHTPDYERFAQDVVDYFASFTGKPLGEMETSAVVAGMMNVLRRHRVMVDPVFTVVHISLLVAEGLGKQLDPSLDLISMMAPFLVEVLALAPPGKPPNRETPKPPARSLAA